MWTMKSWLQKLWCIYLKQTNRRQNIKSAETFGAADDAELPLAMEFSLSSISSSQYEKQVICILSDNSFFWQSK